MKELKDPLAVEVEHSQIIGLVPVSYTHLRAHETDDLRVLDFNGQRVFQLFRFDELGSPILQEQP